MSLPLIGLSLSSLRLQHSGTWETNAQVSEKVRAQHLLLWQLGKGELWVVRTIPSRQSSAEVACLVPYCAPRDRQEHQETRPQMDMRGSSNLGATQPQV